MLQIAEYTEIVGLRIFCLTLNENIISESQIAPSAGIEPETSSTTLRYPTTHACTTLAK